MGARPRGRGLRAPEPGARARREGGRAGCPSLSLGEAWGRLQVHCGGAARGREGDVPGGGVTGPGRPSPPPAACRPSSWPMLAGRLGANALVQEAFLGYPRLTVNTALESLLGGRVARGA